MKIAATEALWDTEQPAAFSLFQIGGFTEDDQTPSFDIEFRASSRSSPPNSFKGQVVGINELQSQAEQEFGPGNYIPDVRLVYWSMRVMAYLGTLLLLLAAWGGWLLWRKKLERRAWFQRAALGAHRAPVPRQLRRLDPDRGGAPALGRLRAPEDRGRGLAARSSAWTVGLSLAVFASPVRRSRRRRLLPDAPLRPARSSRGRAGRGAGRRSRRPRIEMTLEILWFCLLAFFWTAYFVLEGFDFGVGMLLPCSAGARPTAARCSSRSALSGTGTRSGS